MLQSASLSPQVERSSKTSLILVGVIQLTTVNSRDI